MLIRVSLSITLASMLLFSFVTKSKTAATLQYDILIRNGLVVDGSGSLGHVADIAIKGDRIVRMPAALVRLTQPEWWWRQASSICWANPRPTS
jgi:hypothetical protein